MNQRKPKDLDLQLTIAVLRRLGFKIEYPKDQKHLDSEYERYKDQYKNENYLKIAK